MCRLLVWDVDRPAHADDRIEAGRYQRGMVVAVVEDGQAHMSDEQFARGWWKIVEIPDVPGSRVVSLLAPMISDIDQTKLPRKRHSGFDMESLTNARGVIPPGRLIAAESDLEDHRKTYDYVTDSSQIGGDPQVIG